MKKGASNAPFFQSVNCLSAGEVDGGLLPPEKVEGEVVDEPPVEIFVHVAEAVALAGEDEHVEAFARPDERIDDAEGVGRVDVVVDVAVHEEQVALEARGYLGVGGDFVGKSGVALLGDDFLDAVVGLAPPAVVDAVIVVAGAGDGGLEEVGILEHGRRGHESAAGMAVYADAGDVDVGMAGGQLLDGPLVVGEGIVAHVAVAVVMIPFGAGGVSAALSHGDDDESGLGETVRAHAHAGEGIGDGLHLRSRVHVVDDGVRLGGVEVERFVHHAVEVGDPVGGLHCERLGEAVSGGEELGEVALLDGHHFPSVAVEQVGAGDGVHAGVVVDDEAGVVVNLGTVEIVAPGELLQPAAVEVDAVEVGVVGVLFRVAAVSHEVDHARLLVHAQHFLHVPRSLGDAVEQGAVLGI